jgi:DNA mismatch repair protein MutS2
VKQAAPEEEPLEATAPALTSVKPGDRVMVRSVRSQGTVVSGPDEQGQIELQVGILRIKTGLSDLAPLPAPGAVAPEVVERIQREKAALPAEIHLRGMRAEEAVLALEKYLDDALLAGLPRVRIIHGIGTGAIRRAAIELLRSHSAVKSWRAGEPNEGGAGATVAELEG